MLKSAIWGGVIYGGFTFFIGLCDLFGAKGFAMLNSWYMDPPTNELIFLLGYRDKQLPPLLAVMNGSILATIVNTLIGAVIFSLLSSIWILVLKGLFTKYFKFLGVFISILALSFAQVSPVRI